MVSRAPRRTIVHAPHVALGDCDRKHTTEDAMFWRHGSCDTAGRKSKMPRSSRNAHRTSRNRAMSKLDLERFTDAELHDELVRRLRTQPEPEPAQPDGLGL